MSNHSNKSQQISKQETFLSEIKNQRNNAEPINSNEHRSRIEKLATLLKKNNHDAIFIHGGTNLLYFTGVNWSPSERVCGAIIDASAKVHYIVPYFEIGTFSEMIKLDGEVYGWQEHESPYQLIHQVIDKSVASSNGSLAIDGKLPFDMLSHLSETNPKIRYQNGQSLINACRLIKSENEIKLIQLSMNMTLEIQQMVRDILYPGISTDEVHQFIDKAHRNMGFDNGAYFSIVLFGSDTSFPHGVKNPSPMKENDIVLIDCGGQLYGYHSDITRTYFYGKASQKQQDIWHIEQSLMHIAFNAAKLGAPCSNIDKSVRDALVKNKLGPDYQLPGVAHRTGHGIGLEIHEPPFLVLGENTKLTKGMCFSNEPMVCVPNEFGIRIEDHIYMDDTGPVWFTKPPKSIDDCI